ncbi:hypothetical protein F5B22DRAFT_524883 [Xylaria bambusicola]|uniref:uncharacterized protein n=1 Tax=Xylaria bambusicola TaxID=326684 RepID=UPI00200780F1|nr:uncharacterized protein F5B22DRAFT_524883 [Xylaria bambusicola]KAI0505444.1 hypothetical protein F5B22DRAFT_524883 [Xylaria bambusicola]
MMHRGLVTIEEALRNHVHNICGRVRSMMGEQADFYPWKKGSRRRQEQYIQRLYVGTPTRRALALVSTADKVVRETKMARIWLLDLQTMSLMARAIHTTSKYNSTIREPQVKELQRELLNIIVDMDSINGKRQRSELAFQRQRLFKLVKALRQFEDGPGWDRFKGVGKSPPRMQGIAGGSKPPYFLSSKIRELETTLLVAEVLSTELNARVALFHTPQVERDVIKGLIDQGYKSDFEPLPRNVDTDVWKPPPIFTNYPIRYPWL